MVSECGAHALILQLSGFSGSVPQYCDCTLDERSCSLLLITRSRSLNTRLYNCLSQAYLLNSVITLWHMLIKVHSLSFTILTWNWWCLFLHVCMTGVHQGPLLASTLLCLGAPYLPLGLSSYIISSATTSFVGFDSWTRFLP